MALTLTETKVLQIGTNESLVYGTITFAGADTYTTNGFNVASQIPGSVEYEGAVASSGGYVVQYVSPGLFKLFRQTAATGALVEVPNATDVSAASPINFVAVRPS